MVRLEMSEAQAEAVIRDLHRAVVLLDQCGKRQEDRQLHGACLAVGNKLTDLAEDIDNRRRGIEAPVAELNR